ncbi:5-(carboxyamino)imidazole ribonucleotide synthase [Corynebacterium sp. NML120713]|uniref:5-(carboxyamino)imidazole ribonucleotide synthase n=1 Tax=Corynebacterium sp. NML120713 TaxID=1906332 RepID=UPI0008FAFA94|nr:5-(carboxyamino)imidazole ribonucleotide synthase [Corynebacterium sp. NML120713]OIR44505.1 5-(carboxyamino)imidazole ribonucleotide synthase [Corynebacterium sp. NML120713]
MPRVAIIGDGQLARMMHTEAIELGLQPRVLAGAPDASAAQVFGDVQLGDYTNFDDLHATIQGASAITFDHEHVPNEFLQRLLDEGYNVEPRPQALIYAQDKLEQRTKLKELGAPVPPFAKFDSVEDAREFWERVDGRVCVKATRGGYDGHGVWFPETPQECEQLVTDLLEKGVVLYAEEKVDFVRELSAMVARNRDGEVKAWPVVESRQADGVCHIAIAPAPELPADVAKQCRDLATKIATKLDVTGVLAVELFERIGEDGASEILVNELAMRPHNTGHWTQDGCVTSQFEQHLRAVLNWPLGSVDTLEPVTVMVNTLGAEEDPQMPMEQRVIEVMRRYPEAKVHLYGKSWRPGRKMGHVNVTGYDVTSTLAIAQHAAHFIVHANWY